MIVCCVPSLSLGLGLTLEQLNHRSYSAAEGAPSLARTYAQTTDGMLWLGTSAGLFRFDGIRFARYPEAEDEPLPSTYITALAAAPDGGLWIGFLQSGASYLRDGHVTSYGQRNGLPGSAVHSFHWDHSGVLWMVMTTGLARWHGDRWETVETTGNLKGLTSDTAGRIWVLTMDHVLASNPGESEFREVAPVQVPYDTFTPISASPTGAVWILMPGGILRRMDPSATPTDGGQRLSIPGEGRPPVLFDKEGNLWFGGDALYRVSADQLTATNHMGESVAQVERFSHAEGLTAGLVTALFQDREGNIWVATNTGIDRFSYTNAVRLALPLCQGIGYALAAGETGTLWAACPRRDSPVGSLTEIRTGSIVGQQETEKFTAGYRDAEGGVWFGGPTALGHLEGDRVITTPLPDEVRGAPVQLIARGRDGSLWVSVVRKGVFHVTDGQWSLYEPLPKVMAIAETTDPQGVMWFGYTDSRVARMQGDNVRIFDSGDGLNIGHVTAILAQGGEIWAGGELGFARFNGKKFVPISSGCGSSFTGISGIVGTKSGDLWLNAIGGIAHIPHEELKHVAREPDYRVECEILDSLDGVPGNPIQMRPAPSALATTDGRLWFALSGGIISVDPDHLIRNALSPPVRIWSIVSQGKEYPNRGAILELPIRTKDLKVNYTAGSLTVPERVQFRYKLDGSDKDWRENGSRRDAEYTNLGPGSYAFHVIASNNDGKWNEVGSSITFRVAPAFYQTKWFYALCGLSFIGLLAAAHRVRVSRVQARTVRLLEARLAERERIARELHDTLLQGIQGLIWRFQSATNRIPSDQPARELMEQSLDRADQLLAESRDRVKDLRSVASEVPDLTRALAAEGEQLAQLRPVQFRASMQGTRRDLHPIVREEVFLICREALGNAFQHSGAKQIEVEVTYDDAALHVRIRDDGQGIDTTILEAGGKSGHFGLIGMRERAKKLGGEIEIWSKPDAGTEVDLHVPAQAAYRISHAQSSRARRLLDIFRPSSKAN
jgi:signal transduction histidine kinase/ligand-binding sensor domain-containing protein